MTDKSHDKISETNKGELKKIMEIYERLRAAREDTDMTQAQVGEIIGCAREQINRYEQGKQEMPIYRLKKLCLLYHVSADYILVLPRGLDWPR